MVKYFLVLVCLLSIFSCSDDVSFNSPAFQGIRDTVFFKTQATRVELRETDEVIVTGALGRQEVRLTLPSYGEGIFDLGPDNAATADFISIDGKQFSTRFEGEGQVVVERVVDCTYTGSFRFRAASLSDSTEVYFTKGYFYEVPFYNEPLVPEVIPVVANAFFCKINGNPFNPLITNSSSGSSNILGYGSTNTVIIRFIIPKDVEAGTYPLTDFSVSSTYQASYRSGSFNPIIQSGTLTVTSHNKAEKSIGGTFSFTAQGAGTIQITEGFFGFNY